MKENDQIYEELLALPKRSLSFDETNYEKNFAPLIVGVAGFYHLFFYLIINKILIFFLKKKSGSASGKTTLCGNIKKYFKDSCVMISLDSFYYE